MVDGTDAVADLPAPIGELTYNEWHALAMGVVTAILPALALVASFALYRSGQELAAVGFAAGALAYAGGFTALATMARFLDSVPVLREAWYFLATYTTVILLGVVIAVVWVLP
ncbi:MAG: hypothetical protein ABEJ55_02625 [Halanaeroarchaeum sp.]